MIHSLEVLTLAPLLRMYLRYPGTYLPGTLLFLRQVLSFAAFFGCSGSTIAPKGDTSLVPKYLRHLYGVRGVPTNSPR